MKLKSVYLENFRGYQNPMNVEFDDLTFAYVSIGKRSDRIKLLASNVKKVGQTPNQSQLKSQEQDKK